MKFYLVALIFSCTVVGIYSEALRDYKHLEEADRKLIIQVQKCGIARYESAKTKPEILSFLKLHTEWKKDVKAKNTEVWCYDDSKEAEYYERFCKYIYCWTKKGNLNGKSKTLFKECDCP